MEEASGAVAPPAASSAAASLISTATSLPFALASRPLTSAPDALRSTAGTPVSSSYLASAGLGAAATTSAHSYDELDRVRQRLRTIKSQSDSLMQSSGRYGGMSSVGTNAGGGGNSSLLSNGGDAFAIHNLSTGSSMGGGTNADNQPGTSALVNQLRAEIQRLCNTLDSERAEWRHKETEHIRMMRELLSELEAMRRAEAERAKSVASFERELAQAVEAMNAERASWENERAAKSDELALKDEHITRMVALQEEWERRAIAAEERYNTLRQERNNALQEHEQAVAAFRRERSEWQETASQVHAEMEKMQAAHSRELQDTIRRAERAEEAESTAQDRVRRLEADMQRLQAEIDTLTRQRDTARADLAAAESRFEAERQKMEASAVAKMEAEVLRRVTQEQERASQVEARLRDSQRQQMENLMQRHRTEVEDMTSRHEKELSRLRNELTELKTTKAADDSKLQSRAEQAERQVDTLRLHLQQQEAVRNELAGQLQQVLRTHYEATTRIAGRLATLARPEGNIDSLLERAMQDVESTGLRSEGILAGLGAAPGGGSWLGSPARSVTEQSGGHLRHYDYSSASDLHRPTSRSGLTAEEVVERARARVRTAASSKSAGESEASHAHGSQTGIAAKRDYAKPWLARAKVPPTSSSNPTTSSVADAADEA